MGHIGINICEPHEAFNAADFVALAEKPYQSLSVSLWWGEPAYIRALIRGLVDAAVDPLLRVELEKHPNPHEKLQQLDPKLADGYIQTTVFVLFVAWKWL